MFGRKIVAVLLCVLALASAARAQQTPPYLLMDMDSGAIIAEHRAGDLWYPASLTKIMTIYLVFEALRDGRLQMNSPVEISPIATLEPPSRMGFPAGTVITVETALKILVVKSANDVAVAVAEMMAGSVGNFVAAMNRTADRLGLDETRFVNPHGLPGSGQQTSARDMAVLGRAVWMGFPEYRPLFGIGAISYGSTIMPSGNNLLEFYPGANGLKTGYICSSGYNIVASATRFGRTLAVVVLGELTALGRAERSAQLLDAGFEGPVPRGAATVEAFHPSSPTSAPADLRPVVCASDAPAAEESPTTDGQFGPPMIAGRPVVPVVPVPVTTGGADPNARLVVNVPLPRPRPADYPADWLGVARPTDPATVFPFPLPWPG